MASRSWSVIAGVLLLLRALLVILYWGLYTTPLWLVAIPGFGTVPLVPILLVIGPALAGVGILRRAAWARVLGIVLASLFFLLAAGAIIDALVTATIELGALIDGIVEGAISVFIVFALGRRWVPKSIGSSTAVRMTDRSRESSSETATAERRPRQL